MASETSREIQGEVSYRDLTSGPDELPEPIRLRVALDVIEQLFEECAPTLGARSKKSRLRLSNVRVAADGSSRVIGGGDSTGAQLLLWELFATRDAPEPPLPRVHDVVDEISPDVDDVIAKAAIQRQMASIDELLEALVEAGASLAATRAQVAERVRALGDHRAGAGDAAGAAGPAAAAGEMPVLDGSSVPPRASHTRVTGIGADPADAVEVDPDLPSVLVVGAAVDDKALCAAIEEAGQRVICTEIELAQDAIASESPSCVVLDVWHDEDSTSGEEPGELGDAGYRFVHWMRMHDSEAAAIPLLLIAPGAQKDSPLSGFLVGADVCLSRPYRVGDVVAQVGALVRMSTRLRKKRKWLRSRPVQKAFEGNLAHVSVATILSVLEMERRTGAFEVVASHRRVELYFERGVAVRGRAQGLPVSTLSAIESMLGCQRGRFSFTPMSEREGTPRGIGIGELLLEALKRRDEEAHDGTGAQNDARGATR